MEEKLPMHDLADRPYTDKDIEDLLRRLNSRDENCRPKRNTESEE